MVEHQELAGIAAVPGPEATGLKATDAGRAPIDHSSASTTPPLSLSDEKQNGVVEDDNLTQKPVVQTNQGEVEGISGKRRVIIVVALCLNLFLAALDQTIITTALPSIVHDLGDASGYAWCGSSFLIAASTFITSWGKFSDIWGRKPILMVASIIFMIGSIVSATAQNMPSLLAGRTVQGFGAGGIVGLVNITISDIVSARERGKYLAFVGFTWAIASALGPVFGGLFTQKASWRWCFYINLPVGGLAMAAIFFFLHLESPKIGIVEGLKRVDWLGTVLAVTGVTLFLVGLESGGVSKPWDSALVLSFIVIGLALFVAFNIVEWKFAKNPMMPTRLFSSRTNAAAYAVCFFHGQVFIASTFYIPLYVQAVLGKNALLSGAYTLPYVLCLSLGSAAVGIFISKTGRYQEPVWIGCVLMTIGCGLLTNLTRTSSLAKFIPYCMIAGLGQGPLFQGPLIAVHSTIKPQDIGTATASYAFIRNVSAAIGVSIGNVIYQNYLQAHEASLARQVGSNYSVLVSGKEADANVGEIQRLPPNIRNPLRDAYASALDQMWWYFFAMSACAILASLLIGKHVLSTTLNSSQPARNRRRKSGEGNGNGNGNGNGKKTVPETV